MTQTEWLLIWWTDAFSGKYNKFEMLKYGTQAKGRDEKLSKEQLYKTRSRFVNDSVNRNRFPVATSCFLCNLVPEKDGEYWLIRHHIVSLKNWGSNRRINIVTLCNHCHAYLHPWLFKKIELRKQQELDKLNNQLHN